MADGTLMNVAGYDVGGKRCVNWSRSGTAWGKKLRIAKILTKALSSIIIAKQALKNYEKTNIKDMKNKETEQWLIQIRPRYKAKLADVNKKLEL